MLGQPKTKPDRCMNRLFVILLIAGLGYNALQQNGMVQISGSASGGAGFGGFGTAVGSVAGAVTGQ